VRAEGRERTQGGAIRVDYDISNVARGRRKMASFRKVVVEERDVGVVLVPAMGDDGLLHWGRHEVMPNGMVWVAGRAPTRGCPYGSMVYGDGTCRGAISIPYGERAAKCQMAGLHPDLWRHTASRRRRYATGKGK
jgi:hypothetical protein